MAQPFMFSDMGALTPDLNPTLIAGRGALSLVGLGDLYQDGQLWLLPGYSPKITSPVLGSITNANNATSFTNGSRSVTDTTAATDFMTNADVYKRAYPGDFLQGNDGKLYVISEVESDTKVILKTAYEGPNSTADQFIALTAGVDTGADSFTLSAEPGWEVGQAVTYNNGGGASATGLVSGTTYYIASIAGAVITLSDTRFGQTIDITTSGNNLQYFVAYSTYTIIHRNWMLKQFVPQGSSAPSGISQSYLSTALGTFSSTESLSTGISLTKLYQNKATFTHSGTYLQIADISTSTWPHADSLWQGFDVSGSTTITGVILNWTYSGSSTSAILEIRRVSKGAAWTSGSTTVASVYFDPRILANGGTPRIPISYTLSPSYTYYLGIEFPYGSNGTVSVPYCTTSMSESGGVTFASMYEYQHYRTWTQIMPGVWDWVYGYNTNLKTGKAAFSILTYNTSGTYTSPVFDLGFTPAAADTGTMTLNLVNRAYQSTFVNNLYSALDMSGYNPFVFGDAYDTVSWSLTTSAYPDMSSPTTILTGQTGSTAAISASANNKRYWQLAITMTRSSTTNATPILEGASLAFVPAGAPAAILGSRLNVIGVGPYVYYTADWVSFTSISSSESPSGNPGSATQYQRTLVWTTGGGPVRYWTGGAAAGNLSAKTKLDGTAGTDPSLRADCIALHNDKLFLYRNVSGASGTSIFDLVSSALTDTVLTDSPTPSGWQTATDYYVGWRIYPCTVDASATKYNYPLKYWIVTASDSTTVTATDAKMLSYGAAGDTYLLAKNYAKAAWYCDETELAHWPSTNFLQFNDEDGDIIQCMTSWDGRMVVVCREQVWIVTGYGPLTPWSKLMISAVDGTTSPWSVIDSGDFMAWWGTRGIMAYSGGYQRPRCITDPLRSIIRDLNESAREEIVSVRYRGLVLWSFPSSDSNVNDKTLLYHPETGRWAVQEFGMYCPSVFIESDGEEHLYFQEPTTGKIVTLSQDEYFLADADQPFEYVSTFHVPSDPTEAAQGLAVRVSLVSAETMDVAVSWAKDFTSNYTAAGSLEPVDSAGSGRMTVNPTDTAYICKLPEEALGCGLSIRLSGAARASLRIMSVILDTDAIEAATNG